MPDPRDESGWLPIETADRDEVNPVILFNGKVVVGVAWEGGWIDHFLDWLNPQPTHWKALPAPPKEGSCDV